jgi:anti-anti-sigma regulatory factor
MLRNTQKLIYFFAETHYYSQDHSVLVVNIVGPLVKQNLTILQECANEIHTFKSKSIIINFRDVSPEVDPAALPIINTLYKTILQKPAELRLSGIHPTFRSILKEKLEGNPDHFTDNLAQALESLTQVMNLRKAG